MTKDLVNTSGASNVALSGYDPVAFFTDSKPVNGDFKICMHAGWFTVDPIVHTANPSMVFYVYLDYQLCIDSARVCNSKVATRTIQLSQLF